MVEKFNLQSIMLPIEQDLLLIPTNTSTLRFMVALINSGVNRLRDKSIDNSLFFDNLFPICVTLAHAKVHADLVPAERIDGGYYVCTKLDSVFDEKKRVFAQLAISAYRDGFDTVKNTVPDQIKKIIEDFYPFWFNIILGVDFSNEALNVILNPQPMVLPFDLNHGSAFVTGVMRFPCDGHCSFFYNMKGRYLPPTRWVSKNPDNDSEALITYKTQRGVDKKVALLELGSHEAAHILCVDPVVAALFQKRIPHCWFTEAFAQYYGDGIITIRDRVKNTLELSPDKIAFNKDGIVDYGGAFLLIQALAAKLTGSVYDIPMGMIYILQKVADYARLVINNQAKPVENSLDLLYIIDPSLQNDDSVKKIIEIMSRIKSYILQ